ncbi:hypothetical protein DAI22_11g132433 [Oryza sativa Japonica Group]|jgi:hypothetical protein|nr:hypothetical protein DAI22_11g132433 [Oryza sativa Japonica Group]
MLLRIVDGGSTLPAGSVVVVVVAAAFVVVVVVVACPQLRRRPLAVKNLRRAIRHAAATPPSPCHCPLPPHSGGEGREAGGGGERREEGKRRQEEGGKGTARHRPRTDARLSSPSPPHALLLSPLRTLLPSPSPPHTAAGAAARRHPRTRTTVRAATEGGRRRGCYLLDLVDLEGGGRREEEE